MTVTRKAPTAAKKRDKPRRQRLAEVLAEREAELAEARRQNARLFDEVQAKTHDLEEALQEAQRQQTATSDILKVIASSPNDLQPVLDKIVDTACRLCSAYDAVVLLREGDQLRIVAHHGPIPVTFASQQISRGWASGRAVIERRVIHIDDIAEQADEYPVAAALASRGVPAGSGKMLWRANLVVPLMREGEAIGVIGLRRAEAVPFSEGQIELLKTFSDQAVIAIENARLFDEVQAKTRDLTEALEHQTATSEVLAAISRSPTEVQPVFDAIARSATELCGATSGGVDRFDGELIHLASHYNWSPEALRGDGPDLSGRAVPRLRLCAFDSHSLGGPHPGHLRRPGVHGDAGHRDRLPVRVGRADASRRPADRRDRYRPARAAPLHRSTNRAPSNVRRTGRHRHQQRAPVRRGAGEDARPRGIASAADRDRQCSQGDQPVRVPFGRGPQDADRFCAVAERRRDSRGISARWREAAGSRGVRLSALQFLEYLRCASPSLGQGNLHWARADDRGERRTSPTCLRTPTTPMARGLGSATIARGRCAAAARRPGGWRFWADAPRARRIHASRD